MIDDVRTIRGAEIARNYREGIECLRKDSWDVLYIDHDLGDFQNGREYTGYDILCWLEEHPKYVPKKIIVITANPSARVKMDLVLEKLGRV